MTQNCGKKSPPTSGPEGRDAVVDHVTGWGDVTDRYPLVGRVWPAAVAERQRGCPPACSGHAAMTGQLDTAGRGRRLPGGGRILDQLEMRDVKQGVVLQ